MNGIPVARNASRIATLVCVYAPGLMMAQSTPVPRGLVDAVDESVLGVALETLEPVSVALGERGEFRFDVGKRGVAVDLRLAGAEQIQVGAVQQEQLGHSVSLPK